MGAIWDSAGRSRSFVGDTGAILSDTRGATGSEDCLLGYSFVGKILIFPIRPFALLPKFTHLDRLLGDVTVLHSPFFGSGKLEYYLAASAGCSGPRGRRSSRARGGAGLPLPAPPGRCRVRPPKCVAPPRTARRPGLEVRGVDAFEPVAVLGNRAAEAEGWGRPGRPTL